VTPRDADLALLRELLDEHSGELTDAEVEAFADMRFDLQAYGGILGPESASGRKFQQLTTDQRAWATRVRERVVGPAPTRLTAGEIPRGREVPTPVVLRDLPKRPPPLPRPVAAAPRSSRRHCGRTDDGCYAFVNGDCGCGCCS
jgi:hypothetical protein